MSRFYRNSVKGAKALDKEYSMEAPANLVNDDTMDTADTANAASGGKATIRDFITLAKPGILFSNMIAAFGGFWVASKGNVDWLLMLYMAIGAVLVMASSCVLNNYLDRDLDTKMTRTKKRPTATKLIPARTVLIYGIALGVAGLAVLQILVNPLVALLGVLGMFVYVWVYTIWLKRTSVWSTMVGGISGSMPPVIGYCAVTNEMDMGAWVLFWILFLWQPPHFWALGIRRKEEYRAAGFPLLPVVRGNYVTKMAMVRYLVLLTPVSLLLFAYNYVGYIYLVAATGLGMVWLFMCLKGFKAEDDETWARKMFMYSINYLTLLFLVMVLDTVYV
jgi:heme o synthase